MQLVDIVLRRWYVRVIKNARDSSLRRGLLQILYFQCLAGSSNRVKSDQGGLVDQGVEVKIGGNRGWCPGTPFDFFGSILVSVMDGRNRRC